MMVFLYSPLHTILTTLAWVSAYNYSRFFAYLEDSGTGGLFDSTDSIHYYGSLLLRRSSYRVSTAIFWMSSQSLKYDGVSIFFSFLRSQLLLVFSDLR